MNTFVRCSQCSNRATTDNGMCELCRVQDERDRTSVFVSAGVPFRLVPTSFGNRGGPSPTKTDPGRVDRTYHGAS